MEISSIAGESNTPLISVIIACKNVVSYIDEALWSARRQSIKQLEIIIIDDGSTDGTVDRLRAHAEEDPRLRLFQGPSKGPAAARNIGLRAASGDWIAILDGDDIMHPRRFELLLSATAAKTADIVAENQIQFYEDRSPSRYLIEGSDWLATRHIDLATYIRSNEMFAKGPQLGYLKPLIRRKWLGEHRHLYDETLRIGEDYDLIARLLLAGATFIFLPGAFYFYRRHSASISFRVTATDLDQLISAAERLQQALPIEANDLRQVSERRLASLQRADQFSQLVMMIKARDASKAFAFLLAHPTLVSMLLGAFVGGIRRRWRDRLSARKKSKETQSNRAAVIWMHSSTAKSSVFGTLAQDGYQVQSFHIKERWREMTPEHTCPKLRDLTNARGSQLICCDDIGFAEYIPFLLSPKAETLLVTTENLSELNVPDVFQKTLRHTG